MNGYVSLLQRALRGVTLFTTASVVTAFGPTAFAEGVSIDRCVLVSKQRSTVFAARAQGGLAALDLETGAVRWSSSEGHLPVGMMNGALLAQGDALVRGRLELVTLAANNGRATGRQTLELPADVHASVMPAVGRTFQLQATPVGNGLRLNWHAMSTPSAQGMNVPADAPVSASGVRLSQGQFEVGVQAAGLRSARSMAGSEGLRSTLQEVSGFKPADGASGRRFASADGQHILVSTYRKGVGMAQPFEWSIYDRSSSKLLGKVRTGVLVAPFLVVDGALLYVSPERGFRVGDEMKREAVTLHALGLETGASRWSREIRDISLKGPFPH